MKALPPVQRVVTGHDAAGKAIVSSNISVPTVDFKAIPGTVFREIWRTPATPAVIDSDAIPAFDPLTLPPPKHGTRIRFVDIPPDTKEFLEKGAARMNAAFNEISDEGTSTVKSGSPHPLMHRTESVDYGVVIAGEIVLVLDDSEVVLKTGDVVIQRGTNHAWANRTNEMCRMLFMLVDASYNPSLREVLKPHG